VGDNSAPAPDLADVYALIDTKLDAVTSIVTIGTASANLAPAHNNAYLRFVYDTGAKIFNVVASPLSPIGTVVTLRNAAANDLVIVADSGITVNALSPSYLTVPAGGAAQIIKVGASEWDAL
jgi:hypothetical protein